MTTCEFPIPLPISGSTLFFTTGNAHINRWRIKLQKQFIFRARERPVENDTADGNPQRTRIPTAVCKTLLGFAHFPQARRRRSIITTIQSGEAAAYLNEVDFLSNQRGAPQSKRKELSPEHIEEITRLFGECQEIKKAGVPISRIVK